MSTSPGMSPVGPPPVPEKSSKRGCIIAVIVVLLVILIGCIGAFWWMSRNAGKMMALGMSQMRTAAQQTMAPDVPDELKTEFWATFDAYNTKLSAFDPKATATTGGDPNKLVAPMQQLGQAVQDKSLTADEMQRFIDMVKEIEGAAPQQQP